MPWTTIRYRAVGGLTTAILALLLCGFSQPPDDRAPVGATRKAMGTIKLVQRDTMQFVLKPEEGKEMILSIDGRTTVQSTGRNMNWFDLAEGMTATVMYAPKGNQLVAVSIQASKVAPPMVKEPAPANDKAESTGAEPITIKGKISDIKSDLTEMTITTFDDKPIVVHVDEDLQTRLKNSDPNLPKVEKGTEVTAIYLVKNNRNMLVTLRDLVVPNAASNTVTPPATPPGNTTNRTNNTTVMRTPQTGQAVAQVNSPLPLVGMALPAGFVATSNRPLGAIVGQVVQIQQDMIIMSTGTGVASGVVQAGAQQPVGGTNPTAAATTQQAVPNNNAASPNTTPTNPQAQGNATTAPSGNQFFAILAMGSKAPFVANESTRIQMINRGVRLGDIPEGSQVQATFALQTDGTRFLRTINATGNAPGATGTTPANPTDPNLPNQPPANVQPAAGTNPGQAGNVVAGRVIGRKADALFVQSNNQQEIYLFVMANSAEPLRMDEGTRVRVNGQDGRITDLQPNTQIQVFIEMVNNLRRVIGINAGTSANGTGGTGLSGNPAR